MYELKLKVGEKQLAVVTKFNKHMYAVVEITKEVQSQKHG